MATKPECYVASPYGFAESTKGWYNTMLLPMLRQYVTVLDPWEVDVSHIINATPAEKPGLWTDLGEHHFSTIEQKAKLLVAGLDQEPPDPGTIAEMSAAATLRIPLIRYRNDLRTSGEDGMQYNLMLQAAIRRSAGIAVSSLEQLEETVDNYARRIGSGELTRVYLPN